MITHCSGNNNSRRDKKRRTRKCPDNISEIKIRNRYIRLSRHWRYETIAIDNSFHVYFCSYEEKATLGKGGGLREESVKTV